MARNRYADGLAKGGAGAGGGEDVAGLGEGGWEDGVCVWKEEDEGWGVHEDGLGVDGVHGGGGSMCGEGQGGGDDEGGMRELKRKEKGKEKVIREG